MLTTWVKVSFRRETRSCIWRAIYSSKFSFLIEDGTAVSEMGVTLFSVFIFMSIGTKSEQ
ncbi:hypothetical protein VCR4J5_1830002 [Vibrio crassostreae]|uniref:Uncharacterized protein n=1 Tax=Vibrio crassostreae TaxID=246167 RepID=A0ABP1WYH8_9VIBR|nr:hypothetical protein VCR4J5_1830002 [Vibrio crassostreae]